METLKREVFRYLGYRADEADGRMSALALIEELCVTFAEKTFPKSVFGIWDCRVCIPTVSLDTSCAADTTSCAADTTSCAADTGCVAGGMSINSEKLAEHLAGCSRAALLAATLGVEADTLIRRYSVQDMGKAVVAQAVCTAMIEAYCDKIESEITQSKGLIGLCRTARYSPGYGDFDITHQKDIINLLDCGRRIGLALTDGYMLVPSKSVTALIGFTEEMKKAGTQCECCDAKLCEFRKGTSACEPMVCKPRLEN